MSDRSELQKLIAYNFNDVKLLKKALTHRSVKRDNNERLEFLGDSILSLTVTDLLYRQYEELSEGDLSRVRSGLVSGEMLARIARRLDLGSFLVLGPGEIKTGGRERDSILANAVEALIGAIYLDSDLAHAQAFILNMYQPEELDVLANEKLQKDPKSALQEWLQGRKYPLPLYEAEVSGKAHEQTFDVTCRVEGLEHETSGESTNRRKAEQIAAEAYLAILLKKKSKKT